MSHEQTPRSVFLFPDVRKAPFDDLSCNQTRARGIGQRLNRFQTHKDDVVIVSAHELDSPIESRKIDHSGAHERVQNRAPAGNYLVGRRIDHELFGPESFQDWDIAPE